MWKYLIIISICTQIVAKKIRHNNDLKYMERWKKLKEDTEFLSLQGNLAIKKLIVCGVPKHGVSETS